MSQEQLPYLEERKLVKRWRGPIPALMNLAFTLLIFAVTWWVFQDPRGIAQIAPGQQHGVEKLLRLGFGGENHHGLGDGGKGCLLLLLLLAPGEE